MNISGKDIAKRMLGELAKYPVPKKHLVAMWMGSNPASQSFLKQKEETAQKLGPFFRLARFSETITTESLANEIKKMATNPDCGGMTLQLPLPAHIDRDVVIRAIPPGKDVDALTGKNGLPQPAVGVVKIIFEELSILAGLAEQRVAIVGKGFLTGAPLAKWLAGKVEDLTVVDKGDDFSPLEEADIVISGAGIPGFIRPEMLKSGAIGIDFGYGTKDGHVMGDFDPACASVCSAFTPTPGGTGPVLVAQLFTNFYTLCEAHGRT